MLFFAERQKKKAKKAWSKVLVYEKAFWLSKYTTQIQFSVLIRANYNTTVFIKSNILKLYTECIKKLCFNSFSKNF